MLLRSEKCRRIGLGVINAKEPPAIVTRVTEPCLDQAEDVAKTVVDAGNAKDKADPEEEASAKESLLRIELSSDVKQVAGYVIVFLLLAIAM